MRSVFETDIGCELWWHLNSTSLGMNINSLSALRFQGEIKTFLHFLMILFYFVLRKNKIKKPTIYFYFYFNVNGITKKSLLIPQKTKSQQSKVMIEGRIMQLVTEIGCLMSNGGDRKLNMCTTLHLSDKQNVNSPS